MKGRTPIHGSVDDATASFYWTPSTPTDGDSSVPWAVCSPKESVRAAATQMLAGAGGGAVCVAYPADAAQVVAAAMRSAKARWGAYEPSQLPASSVEHVAVATGVSPIDTLLEPTCPTRAVAAALCEEQRTSQMRFADTLVTVCIQAAKGDALSPATMLAPDLAVGLGLREPPHAPQHKRSSNQQQAQGKLHRDREHDEQLGLTVTARDRCPRGPFVEVRSVAEYDALIDALFRSPTFRSMVHSLSLCVSLRLSRRAAAAAGCPWEPRQTFSLWMLHERHVRPFLDQATQCALSGDWWASSAAPTSSATTSARARASRATAAGGGGRSPARRFSSPQRPQLVAGAGGAGEEDAASFVNFCGGLSISNTELDVGVAAELARALHTLQAGTASLVDSYHNQNKQLNHSPSDHHQHNVSIFSAAPTAASAAVMADGTVLTPRTTTGNTTVASTTINTTHGDDDHRPSPRRSPHRQHHHYMSPPKESESRRANDRMSTPGTGGVGGGVVGVGCVDEAWIAEVERRTQVQRRALQQQAAAVPMGSLPMTMAADTLNTSVAAAAAAAAAAPLDDVNRSLHRNNVHDYSAQSTGSIQRSSASPATWMRLHGQQQPTYVGPQPQPLQLAEEPMILQEDTLRGEVRELGDTLDQLEAKAADDLRTLRHEQEQLQLLQAENAQLETTGIPQAQREQELFAHMVQERSGELQVAASQRDAKRDRVAAVRRELEYETSLAGERRATLQDALVSLDERHTEELAELRGKHDGELLAHRRHSQREEDEWNSEIAARRQEARDTIRDILCATEAANKQRAAARGCASELDATHRQARATIEQLEAEKKELLAAKRALLLVQQRNTESSTCDSSAHGAAYATPQELVDRTEEELKQLKQSNERRRADAARMEERLARMVERLRQIQEGAEDGSSATSDDGNVTEAELDGLRRVAAAMLRDQRACAVEEESATRAYMAALRSRGMAAFRCAEAGSWYDLLSAAERAESIAAAAALRDQLEAIRNETSASEAELRTVERQIAGVTAKLAAAEEAHTQVMDDTRKHLEDMTDEEDRLSAALNHSTDDPSSAEPYLTAAERADADYAANFAFPQLRVEHERIRDDCELIRKCLASAAPPPADSAHESSDRTSSSSTAKKHNHKDRGSTGGTYTQHSTASRSRAPFSVGGRTRTAASSSALHHQNRATGGPSNRKSSSSGGGALATPALLLPSLGELKRRLTALVQRTVDGDLQLVRTENAATQEHISRLEAEEAERGIVLRAIRAAIAAAEGRLADAEASVRRLEDDLAASGEAFADTWAALEGELGHSSGVTQRQRQETEDQLRLLRQHRDAAEDVQAVLRKDVTRLRSEFRRADLRGCAAHEEGALLAVRRELELNADLRSRLFSASIQETV